MEILRIEQYNDEFSEKWDEFILCDSVNGTFLQTRNFLNYHPTDRFEDNSLIVYKGNNTVVAVIPACIILEEEGITFYSHRGSTFGGIIVNKAFNNIKHVDLIIQSLQKYLVANKYNKIVIKNTNHIFAKGNVDLVDYFLFKNDYQSYDELSFYIDFNEYKEDIISNFSASRRRDYKYSLKNNLEFIKLETNEEIELFYNILCNNLMKFGSEPVHTLKELFDFKENRLNNIIEFYGVYLQNTLIAGSMVFKFDNKVFHTQYLAADQAYLKLFPMNFLDTNLIKTARDEGFEYFSFGISTEDDGKILNYNLAEFKEGFGTLYSLNKTFYKNI